MKQLLLILITFSLLSCRQDKKEGVYPEGPTEEAEGENSALTPSEKLGKEIFDGKGNCYSCHKPDQKVIGPGIVEIAKIYKEKNGDIVGFLKGKRQPIVDPSQYEIMKTNFSITKNLSEQELQGLEDYMMSHTAP